MRSAREWIRSAVPWWAKGILKVVLSRLPVNYRLQHALKLSRHGEMDDPAIAYLVFRRHFDCVDFHRKDGGFTFLELGPGDSLFSALIGRAHGASASCLVDIGSFADLDVAKYQAMTAFLNARGLRAADLTGATSVADVFAACGAHYEVQGIDSLRRLPDASIDFIFSNTVLQLVKREQLLDVLKELRRILHPAGACAHSIDFRDLMGQSLHHLRFSEHFWEKHWSRRAGIYTNRLRVSEMMEMCRRAGFDAELDEVNRWEKLPVPRAALAPAFVAMPEDDLLVSTVRMILRPMAGNENPARAAATIATHPITIELRVPALSWQPLSDGAVKANSSQEQPQ